MSTITKQDVEHVAQLAKLKFANGEIDGFTDTLGKIITMFEQLGEVDTEGVAFTSNPADNLNHWREDVAAVAAERDLLLSQVPETEEGFIKVPAILEETELSSERVFNGGDA